MAEETLEEKPLGTLSAKYNLAMAAIDPESHINTVHLASGMEELKRRLEMLLGTKPIVPIDESKKAEAEREEERMALEERVASVGS